jgi:gliding motility-associated lipoprotein GldH
MKKVFLLLALTLLFSCNKTEAYKETIKDFPENRWAKKDVKTFKFKLKKDIEAAEVALHLSHVFDPQYTMVPLSVTITHPSGKEDNIFVNMPLKDASGESLSDCTGDYCDLTTTIVEETKFEKGEYKVTIQNQYEHEYLPNVLAFGISVEHDN